MDTESEVLLTLQRKWRQYDELSAQMEGIIKTYGLGSLALEALKRTIGCERVEVTGKNYTAINNDCVEEVRSWPADSIDLYVTSIPFGNHYEYSPSYNDFGHNPDDAEFFKQMDYLTPELLRTLKPGRLPSTFMVVAPGSWDMTVWDDINRMRTLNTSQSRRRQQMHVCPLQLDIVERLINRYSNPGDLVADPFAGLFTVPYLAVKMGRKGKGVELNPDYFRDGVGYCETADAEQSAPTLFDLMEEGEEAAHA